MQSFPTDSGVLFIGAGAQTLKHAQSLSFDPQWRERFPVTGIIDINTDRARHASQMFASLDSGKPVAVTRSIEAMLRHDVVRKLDLIVPVVCTSAHIHEQVVSELARQDDPRIRGLIIEKPLGGSPESATRIADICDSQQWIVGVQEQFFYSQVLESGKALLDGFFRLNRLGNMSFGKSDTQITRIEIDFSKNRLPRSFGPDPATCNIRLPHWPLFEGPHALAVADVMLGGEDMDCTHATSRSMVGQSDGLSHDWRTTYDDYLVYNDALGMPTMASIPHHGGGEAHFISKQTGTPVIITSNLDGRRKRNAKVYFAGGSHYLEMNFDPGTDENTGKMRTGSVRVIQASDETVVYQALDIPDNCLAKSLQAQFESIRNCLEPRSSLSRNRKLVGYQSDMVRRMIESVN